MSRRVLLLALGIVGAHAGLLKNIDPIVPADLLYVLRSMGHGDRLCICDCNFPASEVAAKTTSGRHIVLSGVDLPRALEAICSLLPLDGFVDTPATVMGPQEGAELPPAGEEVHSESAAVVAKHSGFTLQPIERFDFYDEARTTFAVVQTLERRPYGNVILQKGVIGPDGRDLKP